MCYSARVWANYRSYVDAFGAVLDISEFARLFAERKTEPRMKIPKAMESAFEEGADPTHGTIRSLIADFQAHKASELEQELFKQRTRLADSQRRLAVKVTKAAQESSRIAASKIARARQQLEDLRRVKLEDRDSRIFPGHYAPVLVMEEGALVVKPMRYQCRPAGKPAFFDGKFPGTYNARRDNLKGFWNELYGYTHGIVVVNSFYENVSRHRAEGRELKDGEQASNVVLEFDPRPQQDMLVACVWSRWSAPGQSELLSFAAITDEPPPEVMAAGHDRCIVPIKPDYLRAWLDPQSAGSRDVMDTILEDKARPYYQHRWLLAA